MSDLPGRHLTLVLHDTGPKPFGDPRQPPHLFGPARGLDGLVEVNSRPLQIPRVDEISLHSLEQCDVVIVELGIVKVEISPGGGLLDAKGGEDGGEERAGDGASVEEGVGDADQGPVFRLVFLGYFERATFERRK